MNAEALAWVNATITRFRSASSPAERTSIAKEMFVETGETKYQSTLLGQSLSSLDKAKSNVQPDDIKGLLLAWPEACTLCDAKTVPCSRSVLGLALTNHKKALPYVLEQVLPLFVTLFKYFTTNTTTPPSDDEMEHRNGLSSIWNDLANACYVETVLETVLRVEPTILYLRNRIPGSSCTNATFLHALFSCKTITSSIASKKGPTHVRKILQHIYQTFIIIQRNGDGNSNSNSNSSGGGGGSAATPMLATAYSGDDEKKNNSLDDSQSLSKSFSSLTTASPPSQLLLLPVNSLGQTPLHLLAHSESGCLSPDGLTEYVTMCKELGGIQHPLRIQDIPDGNTPLHTYLLNGATDHLHCAVHLDPGACCILNTKLGFSPLHMASSSGLVGYISDKTRIALFKAAAAAAATALLPSRYEENPFFFREKTDGNTPLHTAVKSGNIAIIDALIDCCPEAASLTNNALHATPLHFWKPALTDASTIAVYRKLVLAYPQAALLHDTAGNAPVQHIVVASTRNIAYLNILADIVPDSVKQEGPLTNGFPLHSLLASALSQPSDLEFFLSILHAWPAGCLELGFTRTLPLLSVYLQGLDRAKVFNPLEVLEAIVRACPACVSMVNPQSGETFLHEFALKGKFVKEGEGGRAVELLVKTDPSMCIKLSTSMSHPPLVVAVNYQAKLDMIQALYTSNPSVILSRTPRDGKTPLDHAVTNKASADVIEYLRQITETMTAAANEGGALSLHAAIESGATLKTIQSLVKKNPLCVKEPDAVGLLPLHLTFPKSGAGLADVQVYMLQAYPDAARITKPYVLEPGELMRRALSASTINAEVVAALLVADVPVDPITGEARTAMETKRGTLSPAAAVAAVAAVTSIHFDSLSHAFSWITFVQHEKSDQIACLQALDAALEKLAFSVQGTRSFLASTDATGRKLVDIAIKASVRDKLRALVFIVGRYELLDIRPVHQSATSILYRAIDHEGMKRKETNDASRTIASSTQVSTPTKQSSGILTAAGSASSNTPSKEHFVALKFMKEKQAFIKEKQARHSLSASLGGNEGGVVFSDISHVSGAGGGGGRRGGGGGGGAAATAAANPRVAYESIFSLPLLPLIASYDSDQDTTFALECRAKGYSAHPYLLVMPAADDSLFAVLIHERVNEDEHEVRRITRQLCTCLSILHANGVIHGDIKPLNIVRIGTAYKLIDFDASANTRREEKVSSKLSTGFIAPEIAKVLLRLQSSSAAVASATLQVGNVVAQRQQSALPIPPPPLPPQENDYEKGKRNSNQTLLAHNTTVTPSLTDDPLPPASAPPIMSVLATPPPIPSAPSAVKFSEEFSNGNISQPSSSSAPLLPSFSTTATATTTTTTAAASSTTITSNTLSTLPLMASSSMDMWAFGVTLYQIITGASLFHCNKDDNLVLTPTTVTSNNIITSQMQMLAEWDRRLKAEKLDALFGGDMYDPTCVVAGSNDYSTTTTTTNTTSTATSALNASNHMSPGSFESVSQYLRSAHNILSRLLTLDPTKRLSASQVLRHPFVTGAPLVRGPHEKADFDVFLSYRVATDAKLAESLYGALTSAGIKVWWDKKCLKAGEKWMDAFCAGLVQSSIFLPIVSINAIAGMSTGNGGNGGRAGGGGGDMLPVLTSNWTTLTSTSACDNVLLEHRLALELQEQGLLGGTDICPLFVGKPTGTTTTTAAGDDTIAPSYTSFFTSGEMPRKESMPALLVRDVETAVNEKLEICGLGSSMLDRARCTVRSVYEGLLGFQAVGTIQGDALSRAQSVLSVAQAILAKVTEKRLQGM